MTMATRRYFLNQVGQGMLAASIGSAMAQELGIASAALWDDPPRLHFGAMEPLVAMMQETPIEKLLPLLTQKWSAGTPLKTLVAAGALANARAFGGQDYTGHHTFMALTPSMGMAERLPTPHKPLPVLKVLYRNTQRIQDQGGRSAEVLHEVPSADHDQKPVDGLALREAMRSTNMQEAEARFARMVRANPQNAFDEMQAIVHDQIDVHRVVLAWRAWETLDLTGIEQAHTLLRQSVRYCVLHEDKVISKQSTEPAIRHVLPKLLESYGLLGKKPGQRRADESWIEHLAKAVYQSQREAAADAVAQALAEGFHPDDIGEAISLAANALVLHDPGRPADWATENKPAGSVHGDSIGVHASDAANAWRNIARASSPRNGMASLIVAGFHTAGQNRNHFPQPFPHPDHLDAIRGIDPHALLGELETAVRGKDQARACALVHQCGASGQAEKPIFDLLLRFAVSEDGALHAEKYYQTVVEEFARSRPAFRWRHLASLARVTASEFGFPAPGYAEACALLQLK